MGRGVRLAGLIGIGTTLATRPSDDRDVFPETTEGESALSDRRDPVFERFLAARPWLASTCLSSAIRDRSLRNGRHIRGSDGSCRRPVSRRDLNLRVRCEIRHVVFDLLDREGFTHPCPHVPAPRVPSTTYFASTSEPAGHLLNISVQLELVGDQHLAADAQAAGLSQPHEAE